MTIEDTIKEIEGRLGKPYFVGKDHQMTRDITFLLSELKRCREALEKIENWNPHRPGGKVPYKSEIARQALHPEGVK